MASVLFAEVKVYSPRFIELDSCVIFDVFNLGAAENPNVTSEDVGPFTLDYVTTKICEYPEANYLIL